MYYSRFVDNGITEGFIPSSALTAYKEMYHDNNLIEFENDSSSNNQVIIRSNSSNQLSLLNRPMLVKDLAKEEVPSYFLDIFSNF